MKISSATKIFGVISVAYVSSYFLIMNWLINMSNVGWEASKLPFGPNRSGQQMTEVTVIIGTLWLITGRIMLRMEDKRSHTINPALIYNSISFITLVTVSVIAYLAGHKNFQAIDIGWAASLGGLNLLVNLIRQKDSLKGIKKSEAFQ